MVFTCAPEQSFDSTVRTPAHPEGDHGTELQLTGLCEKESTKEVNDDTWEWSKLEGGRSMHPERLGDKHEEAQMRKPSRERIPAAQICPNTAAHEQRQLSPELSVRLMRQRMD